MVPNIFTMLVFTTKRASKYGIKFYSAYKYLLNCCFTAWSGEG